MKIVGLIAENIKKLVAVEISPTGAVVQITGKNGMGKTSILDCIWWALKGATHIQTAPIRDGEDHGFIRLDLGEMIVRRTFDRRDDGDVTTSVSVHSANGARIPSPQKALDALIGALSMDPLAFMRAKPEDQLKTLRGLVPKVDFAAIDKANKADFDKRTDVNRDAKALRAQAAAITFSPGTPLERIDETALVAELEKAGEVNADLEARKARRQQTKDAIANLDAKEDELVARAADLRRQAADLDQQAQEATSQALQLQEKLAKAAPLPDPIDTAEVRRKIEHARKINEGVDARARRGEIEKRCAALERESDALSKTIEKRKADMEKAIAAAGLPVAGLSLGADQVMLDGLPLDQASDAMQLRTSMAIAMALNPKLRVIRVRDGSLLDSAAMKVVAEMAEAEDFQIWIERVDDSGKVGFVIEDGSVVARPEPLKAAE